MRRKRDRGVKCQMSRRIRCRATQGQRADRSSILTDPKHSMRQEKSRATSSLKRPVGSASGQSESASADATGASSAPRFSAFGGDRTANRSLMHSATALCVIGIGDF
jgi:hypothetical protein